jgi:hypothetical protein
VQPITPEEARALAATLRKIAPAYVRQDPDRPGTRTRYCGDEPYFDVYLDVDDGKPIWFQLTVRGLSVTWSPDGGTVTGKTNELAVADNPFPGSKILTDDRTRNATTIEIARAILDARAGEPHFAEVSKALG